MPVELRKRKAPAAPPPPPPPAKKKTVAKAATKAKEAVKEAAKPIKKAAAAATTTKKTNGAASKSAAAKPTAKPAAKAAAAKTAVAGEKPEVGSVIELEGFGGEVTTHDGTETTLKALVDESKAGVVLFTYPKASTPGCKSILRYLTNVCSHHIAFSSISRQHCPLVIDREWNWCSQSLSALVTL